MYNLTNLTSATGWGDVAVFANQVSGGVLLPMFTLAIVLIILMALIRNGGDFLDAALASFFSGFIISGLLYAGGLLSGYYALAYLLIVGLAGLFKLVAG